MKNRWRLLASTVALIAVFFGTTFGLIASASASSTQNQRENWGSTTTPIQHLVVIFQENVSFDHYFATYPYATNPSGEPSFSAKSNTPTVNGLTPELLTNNPNLANPQRLDRSQSITCDQDHAYTDEQKAYNSGLLNQFVQSASGSKCTDKSTVMDYYDGNTVTALWNYAQNYALNDNSFGTTYGPSTPGALNLISGQTHGATPANFGFPGYPVTMDGTVLNDNDPAYDDCSAKGTTIAMSGKNIGNLLNNSGVTWGWFEGGFAPSSTVNGKAVCATVHTNSGGASVTDYIPHHEPFQYYQSTANPHHLPPGSISMIGKTDQANHQYDLQYFWDAVDAGNLPGVSFLKAPASEDGHAGYSGPLDEQAFLVNTLNKLQHSSQWKNTAVVISYDDSDGWYDHVIAPVVNQSNIAPDALTGAGACGTAKAGAFQGRCGYGPRLPLLVISPYAKQNFVDHTLTDQSSILRFIEDNWQTGRIGNQSFDALAGSLDNMFNFQSPNGCTLTLDPKTGKPVS